MSGDESFLARWSRRKRGAASQPPGPAAPEAPAASVPPGEAPPSVAPAELPPIESIDAATDIRAFLAAGVPADLTRAALRRAWSADPQIRDFIGLSENSWDFTAPGGVPGFGTVTEAEVRRLLGRLLGDSEATDPEHPAVEEAAPPPASDASPGADATRNGSTPPAQENPEVNIAVQQETAPREDHQTLPRHRHGGALPK